MDSLKDLIITSAKNDEKGLFIELDKCKKIAKILGVNQNKVEKKALELEVLPERYLRNRNTINLKQQKLLAGKKVVVVGCGGLGGYLAEQVARIGVGKLVVIDGDVFAAHNLNRQLASLQDNIGKAKAKVTKKKLKKINSNCKVKALSIMLDDINAKDALKNADIVLDGLDNIQTRLLLAKKCQELNIVLIHGAIAGFHGQVTTVLPEKNTIDRWYMKIDGKSSGQEVVSGNPAFTPAVIASLQVAEMLKYFLGKGDLLVNKMLLVDLLAMDFQIIDII